MTEVFNSYKVDFLTLENLLAENVDCVVMCIESAGSIAELGAFVNYKDLRKKLLVILEREYKNERSFINMGPVKMLKKNQILWYDSTDNKSNFNKKIGDRVRKISKDIDVKNKLTNPITNERFLLSLLYCLGSLSNKEMIEILKKIITDETEPYIIMSKAVMNTLFWQKNVYLKNNRYYLTDKGITRFKKLFKYDYLDTMKMLDNFRINILTEKLRTS